MPKNVSAEEKARRKQMEAETRERQKRDMEGYDGRITRVGRGLSDEEIAAMDEILESVAPGKYEGSRRISNLKNRATVIMDGLPVETDTDEEPIPPTDPSPETVRTNPEPEEEQEDALTNYLIEQMNKKK